MSDDPIKPPAPMSEPLQRAIVESGMSYKSLSRETGVTRASIQRFVDGKNSLHLDIACVFSLHTSKNGRSFDVAWADSGSKQSTSDPRRSDQSEHHPMLATVSPRSIAIDFKHQSERFRS